MFGSMDLYHNSCTQCTTTYLKRNRPHSHRLHPSPSLNPPPPPPFTLRPFSGLDRDTRYRRQGWANGSPDLLHGLITYDDRTPSPWWIPPYFYHRLPLSLQNGLFNHHVYARQPKLPPTWEGVDGGRVVARLYLPDKPEGVQLSMTMRYRQPSRPPVELYERFPRPEIGEMAGAVLVECCHANRFNVLEIMNQRDENQKKAKEKAEKSEGLRLPHLPNELLIMIWKYAAEGWVGQGCEYLPIPLSTNGNPATTNGYLLQIEPLLKDVEPFNLLWACRDSRAAMYNALLSEVGVEDPIEPGMLPMVEAGKREDVLLFLRDTTKAGMETNKPNACGLLIQDFRLPNLEQRMAAEQERLKEMAQEVADIAVVDEFIRIERLKNCYAEEAYREFKEGYHEFKTLYAVLSGRFSAAEVLDLERTYDEDQPEPEISDRSEGYARAPTLSWGAGGNGMGGWRRRGALMRRGGGGRAICRPRSPKLREMVRWTVDHRWWEEGMDDPWDQARSDALFG